MRYNLLKEGLSDACVQKDALIVASMCWVAWKNRDAFSATRIVFSKWLQLAFETNAITFTLCLATAIAYGVKKPYYGAPFSFICAKLYDLTLSKPWFSVPNFRRGSTRMLQRWPCMHGQT